jgi:hypothetical protein
MKDIINIVLFKYVFYIFTINLIVFGLPYKYIIYYKLCPLPIFHLQNIKLKFNLFRPLLHVIKMKKCAHKFIILKECLVLLNIFLQSQKIRFVTILENRIAHCLPQI